jgi:rsbT co-antagonist protein RsbR
MSYRTSQNFSAQELLDLYGITGEDLERIQAFRELGLPRIRDIAARFYAWLGTRPEFEQFFSDREVLERVQELQVQYWEVFMSGRVDPEYVEARYGVGVAHARIGLPLNVYFAGMNCFLSICTDIVCGSGLSAQEQVDMTRSLSRLLHLDTAIVVDTYNQIVEDTLTAQSKSLMEMSTPVTQIWEGILLLPIVGLIDSHRASDIMNATLAKIAETQAQIFILDISGVGVVDTAVANNLIKITSATRLMGCECTISGVSPAIAQTVVDLGIDVGRIKTTATMKDALSDAFRRSGMEISGRQRSR